MKRKIIVNPKFGCLREYVESIPRIFETEGETIYHKRNHIKVMKAPDGTVVNVKRYQVPRGINRYVYSLGIRKPKGERAYLYPQRLLEKGIETPEPIAYIEERSAGLLEHCYFISVQSPYAHTMYELGNAKAGEYEDIANAFALFTARMHEREVLHLDYSPGNILFDRLDDGTYRFSLVDTNRMYFGPVDMKKGVSAFKRIWGSKRFVIQAVRQYADCRGYDADRAVAYALKVRSNFWKRYSRKHPVEFKLEL